VHSEQPAIFLEVLRRFLPSPPEDEAGA
jgi:hypothetical protein